MIKTEFTNQELEVLKEGLDYIGDYGCSLVYYIDRVKPLLEKIETIINETTKGEPS